MHHLPTTQHPTWISLPTKASRFWTDDLQALFDRREQARRKWKRTVGINKVLRWQEYEVAAHRFKSALYCRRRATWKQFCETLSSGPLSDTTATIKRIRPSILWLVLAID
ncbi:hypothetical protein G6F28_014025 [Rhizopus arrhizus]|nr:hypothetical protein G6F28_014025 [Rhizopus arrhizus]KAG1244873.1 hypothetical protein G6F65_021566 [Rhizopus arrhizus]KAG1246534.1 hypothetical protein G6F65_020633 [Rhizopus arrhizus]